MSVNKGAVSQIIIARGERVMLRGWLASDGDPFVRWLAHGEWLLFDAPWEESRTAITAEDERRNREWFIWLDLLHSGILREEWCRL